MAIIWSISPGKMISCILYRVRAQSIYFVTLIYVCVCVCLCGWVCTRKYQYNMCVKGIRINGHADSASAILTIRKYGKSIIVLGRTKTIFKSLNDITPTYIHCVCIIVCITVYNPGYTLYVNSIVLCICIVFIDCLR